MTKSYIFDSGAFSGDESGGIFYKGRRRFRFECSSPEVVSRIGRLESTHAPFPADELPDNVLALLLREGLLREYKENHGAWSISVNMKTCASIVLLPRPVVRALVVPIALLCGPVTMCAALVLETAWLAGNLAAHAGFFDNYAALDGFTKLAVLALVFVSILFHELCHAAVGYKRGGGIGEVRLGTMAYMPHCFTTIPGFSTMTKPDRLAVLSGGIAGQLALAMTALALTPEGGWVHIAAETAIIVALCNMLPIPGLDGYGILRELRSRTSRNVA
jgi:Zn-dependent protease